MLKRDIKYVNFDDEEVTETFYFNLSKSELIEYESTYGGKFQDFMKTMIKSEDTQKLIQEFKKLILLSYGEKSPDGRRFVKSDTLREEFSQTAAYDTLFMELATNETLAAEFITSIMPSDMRQSVELSVVKKDFVEKTTGE